MNRHRFDKALWKAFRLDFHLGKEFNLKVIDGHYMLSPDAPLLCHPLECVLLGEEAGDSVREDIADRLECTLEFVQGFREGWRSGEDQGLPEDCVGEYRAGYEMASGREFRVF